MKLTWFKWGSTILGALLLSYVLTTNTFAQESIEEIARSVTLRTH